MQSLVEIGQAVLEKKIFLKSRQCIFAISCHLPLGKGVVLHLNKLESPLLKNALCQVRFKWVLGKKDFKILSAYLSLEKN